MMLWRSERQVELKARREIVEHKLSEVIVDMHKIEGTPVRHPELHLR